MKTINLIITTFFCFTFLIVSGQSWKVAWDKQLGNQKMNYFKDVIPDKNGGYTVLGSVYPKGNTSYDLWLVRFNENGDTLWTKILGTAFTDIPKRLLQTSDGSYLLTGVSKRENLEILYLIKTDTNGKEQWRKIFNDGSNYSGEDVASFGDEDFLLVGSKSTDNINLKRWMVKLDKNGEVIWEKDFGDDFNGCCKSIRKLPDNGFAVTGQMEKAGQKDCNIWIARLNDKLDFMWNKEVPSPGLKVWPECLCCSHDSCFIVVGWQGNCMNDINSDDPVFDYDLVLLKVDKNGKVIWNRNFDKEGSEGGNAVTVRPDGNFIVAGAKVTSFLGKTGPWMMLVDQQGNILGETLINMHFNRDQAIKVINSSDGGIIVIGPGVQDEDHSASNGWIMKFTDI